MESSSTQPVRLVVPAAPYIGGKKRLSKFLVSIIDRVDHVTYAEPFVGMGGVFLRRTRRPHAEVINDLSRDVATLFRILQHHYTPLMDILRYQITSRDEFRRLLQIDPSTMTDLQRAARFLYVQRCSFGGRVASRTFGVSVQLPGRFDVIKLGTILADISERLSGVVIECLDYGKFIKTYDRPETLFYLDPPYYQCENYYGAGMFSPADFHNLSGILKGINGQFILSLNDHPEVRSIFSPFKMDVVETTYTVGGGDKIKPVTELVISNFDFPTQPVDPSLF